MAKGDLRAAAERLERGIERYGDGDLVAAAVEFEEALKLSPDHPRARQYLSWVKDVLAGTRGSGKKKELDEDAVRAVSEALDVGDEATVEGPWVPSPLTPANPAPQPPLNTIPYGLEEAIAVRGTAPTDMAVPKLSEISGAPIAPAAEPKPEKPPEEPKRKAPTLLEAPKLPEDKKTQSSPTILGMAPPREPMLRAVSQEERPESVTREFSRPTPTMHNLPPLDVPELTEAQVAELISLESSLPTTGPGGRSLEPDIAATPDLPTEQRPTFIEFEAEATPAPHRAPQRVPEATPPSRKEPHLKLQPPSFSDFDPVEMTPTHARLHAEPRDVVNPLPVDEEISHGDEEVTQNPTNPFIRQNLADYAFADAPKGDDELSAVPTGRHEVPKPSIADIMAQAKRVLAGGDAQTAVDIADDVVTAAGGVDAEPCLPFLSLLEIIYASMIGSPDQQLRHGGNVPDLDPRAAFLLSRIDGSLSVDDLLEVSGMPRLEAMRVLALLIRHGAVVTS